MGQAEGRARFVSALTGGLAEALQEAGLHQPPTFAAACLGLSGGPEDKAALVRELVRAEDYLITHDAVIALAGATSGLPGMVVIAGTGSIAYGRNAQGHTARAGGWGHVFGDEGGAFDLVRQALRATLRYEEGWGPPTTLLGLLLTESGAETANDLLHHFYTDQYTRDRIAGMANLVDEAAVSGDPVAVEIIRGAAQSLATLAAAVRTQLFPHEPSNVYYSGGVFDSLMLREQFRWLAEMGDHCTVSEPKHGPAVGALLEAYRIAGNPVTVENMPEGL